MSAISWLLFCSACTSRPTVERPVVPVEVDTATLMLPELARYELKVDPQSELFNGRLLIDFNLSETRSQLSLHAGRNLTCERWRVRSREAAEGAAERSTLTQITAESDSSRERLKLRFTPPLEPGAWQLEGHYEGRWRELPVTRISEDEDQYFLINTREGRGRALFPGRDDYRSKLLLTLSAPSGIRLVGLGGEAQKSPDELSVTLQFQLNAGERNTSELFFAFGPFEERRFQLSAGRREEGGEPPRRATLITAQGMSTRLLRPTRAMLRSAYRALAEFFNVPAPKAQLLFIALPGVSPILDAEAGVVIMPEEQIFALQNEGAAQRAELFKELVRPLARHWLSPWVRRGGATWLADGLSHWLAGELVSDQKTLPWQGYRRAVEHFWSIDEELEHPLPLFRLNDKAPPLPRRVRRKLSALFSLISRWVGPTRWRESIQTLVQRDRRAEDLFDRLSVKGYEIKSTLESYLSQAGVPLLRFSEKCGRVTASVGAGTAGGASADATTGAAQHQLTLTVEQSLLGRKGSLVGGTLSEAESAQQPAPLWRVPFCFRLSGEEKSRCRELKERVEEFKVGPLSRCPAWVLPNDEQSGRYLWAFKRSRDYSRLLRAMGKPGTLSPLNQALLADQLLALVELDLLKAPYYLSALTPMANHASSLVRLQLLRHLQLLERLSTEPDRFRQAAEPLLRSIKPSPRSADRDDRVEEQISSLLSERLAATSRDAEAAQQGESLIKEIGSILEQSFGEGRARRELSMEPAEVGRYQREISRAMVKGDAATQQKLIDYLTKSNHREHPLPRALLIYGLGSVKAALLSESLALLIDTKPQVETSVPAAVNEAEGPVITLVQDGEAPEQSPSNQEIVLVPSTESLGEGEIAVEPTEGVTSGREEREETESPLTLSFAEQRVLLSGILGPDEARAAWEWLGKTELLSRDQLDALQGEITRIASFGCDNAARDSLQNDVARRLLPNQRIRDDLLRQIERCITLREALAEPSLDYLMMLQTALQPVSRRMSSPRRR
ncbi:MAG: hypothetical protein VYD19_00980 [Myxococcota bacterium]|nr:hypothetical protein [Myxococcota bacterium]